MNIIDFNILEQKWIKINIELHYYNDLHIFEYYWRVEHKEPSPDYVVGVDMSNSSEMRIFKKKNLDLIFYQSLSIYIYNFKNWIWRNNWSRKTNIATKL